jgi:protein-tyrosine-phosphatase
LNDQLLELVPEDTIQTASKRNARSTEASALQIAHPELNKPEVTEALQRHRDRQEVDRIERQFFTLQTRFRSLEKENDDYRHELEANKVDLKIKTHECTELSQHLGILGKEVIVKSEQINRIRKEQTEAPRELDRVRKELDRVVLHMATEVALVDPYYFDDAYFQRQFSSLRSNIKNWANRAFSTSSKTKKKCPQSTAEEFGLISKDWEIYMGSDAHRPSFVQAYVWNFLFSRVLGGRFLELPSSSDTYTRRLEKKIPRGTFNPITKSNTKSLCRNRKQH